MMRKKVCSDILATTGQTSNTRSSWSGTPPTGFVPKASFPFSLP